MIGTVFCLLLTLVNCSDGSKTSNNATNDEASGDLKAKAGTKVTGTLCGKVAFSMQSQNAANGQDLEYCYETKRDGLTSSGCQSGDYSAYGGLSSIAYILGTSKADFACLESDSDAKNLTKSFLDCATLTAAHNFNLLLCKQDSYEPSCCTINLNLQFAKILGCTNAISEQSTMESGCHQ
jgi:hypothetical protein